MRTFGIAIPRGRQGVYWLLATWVAKLARPNDEFEARVGQCGKICVNLRDPYWTRLFIRGYAYEADIQNALLLLSPLNFAFVDGGANVGFWPVFLASEQFRITYSIAIEASPKMCASLSDSIRRNALDTKLICRALSDTDGEVVALSAGINHSGTHIAAYDDRVDEHQETTITVTLEKVFEDNPQLSSGTVVVKLDVEGAEIRAMYGAFSLMNRPDVVMIYEDHGRDPDSAVTTWMLENTERKCLLLLDGAIIALHGADELQGYKTNPNRGYNIAAIFPDSVAGKLLLAAT